MIAKLSLVLIPVISFLAGSIPTGYLVGKSHGIDIRQHGSGNIGATNVSRVMGRPWGWLVFAVDFLKGFLPIFGSWWLLGYDNSFYTEFALVIGGVASILGHNYTPWLGFKGGKGIATSAGVLAALMPLVLFCAWFTWMGTVVVGRIVSLASICACVVLPVACYFIYPGQWMKLALACAACLFGIWRHRSNIQRLIKGVEPRLGQPLESVAKKVDEQ